MKISNILISICIVLVLLSGCATSDLKRENRFETLLSNMMLRRGLYPEADFSGHLELVDTALEGDSIFEVYDAVFEDLSRFEKDPYEKEVEYQNRMAKYDFVERYYTFIVHPDFCEYEPYPELDIYQIYSKDATRGISQKITIAEVESRVLEYENEVIGSLEHERCYVDRYNLVIERFGAYPLNIIAREGGTLIGKPHLGISINTKMELFIEKLRSREIGIALRVKIGDLRKAYIKQSGVDLDYASYNKIEKNYFLPVQIYDVWIINMTNLHGFAHWTRDDANGSSNEEIFETP